MHPKSIEGVSNSYLCCNCGACKNVCPQNAIEFKETSIGRLNAYVTDKCIDCSLCQKVCPSLETNDEYAIYDDLMGQIYSVSVGKATDSLIFNNAQSGGICTALLKYLFDSKKIEAALVCRMEYGNPVPIVKSTIVSSVQELAACQKSCYTPVELLSILKEKQHLYKSIAVVGIGCQIEGLMRIQKINKLIDSKIYCKIGLICDRTLCGSIQDVYASQTPHFKSVKIFWRCKFLHSKNLHLQYRNAPLIIENENGETKELPNDYRFILKDMFTAPRCRICPNKLNLFSDITLGDPWRMPNIDWRYGESLVVSRTDIGLSIITEALNENYISLSLRPKDELYSGQLIENRKYQISSFAKAFYVLHPTVESHLLFKSNYAKITDSDIKKASDVLLEFKSRENMTKDRIIKDAQSKLSKIRLKKSILYRFAAKLYHICTNK